MVEIFCVVAVVATCEHSTLRQTVFVEMERKRPNFFVLRLIDSVAQLIHPAVISKKYEIWSGPGPVMYEDPKIAKILVLGDSVPEIRPKNRFWVIFGPFFGFFQNPVKSIWL